MEWLSQYASAVTAVGTLGLLAVWIVYAHVFYKNLRRQQRPRIIIDCMPGSKANPVIAMTNLSTEPIYVECVLGVAFGNGNEYTGTITEGGAVSTAKQSERELVSIVRQGPIATGRLMSLGTLDEILECSLRNAPEPSDLVGTLKGIEVRVVATMSSEDQVIGAWKRFEFTSDDHRKVSAEQLGTAQMYSRKDKRRVLGWLGRG